MVTRGIGGADFSVNRCDMATVAQIRRLRKRLVRVARAGDRVAYSSVDHIVGLDMAIPADRGKLGGILADIGGQEVRAKHPFLPAVVVHKWSRRPGKGFYLEVRSVCGARYRNVRGKLPLHDAVLRDVHRYWRAR